MRYLLFFLLFVPAFSFGQNDTVDPRTADYSKADSIALNFPKKKYKSYTELVAPLTQGLSTEHEKLRVLFRWVTDNIQYSYGNPSDNADKALRNKKAVCIGYANLLKEMCISAGIECEVIVGYSKTLTRDIGKKMKKTDHAWNAVKLYGKWYLFDATWATSYVDMKTNKFIKAFDDFYFLTPPEEFIKTHLPEDKKWQLLDNKVSRSEFSKWPVYFSNFFKLHLGKLDPGKGELKIDQNDSLELRFHSGKPVDKVAIDLGNNLFYREAVLRTTGEGQYFVREKFDKPGTYDLTLFVNDKCVAWYRVVIKK